MSISAIGTVTEGPNVTANYTITSDIIPHDNIKIQYLPLSTTVISSELQQLFTDQNYTRTDTSSFLPGGVSGLQQSTPQSLIFTPVAPNNPSNTQATATLRVPLDDDDEFEYNGTIRVTLQDESPANVSYQVHNVNDNATLNVRDNDLPVLRVEPGDAAVESPSGSALFWIFADKTPDTIVRFYYNVSESGNFIDSSNEGQGKSGIAQYINGSFATSFAIPIVSDDDTEDDGTITVTLVPDQANPATYEVAASPNNTGNLQVFDDDSLPTVSIAAESNGVAENANPAQVQFDLTATGLTGGSARLMINATPVNVVGSFLRTSDVNTPRNHTVQFLDGDGDSIYEGRIPISIVDNTDPGATGQIQLRLNAASSIYRLGSTTAGNISIWDNEAPELKVEAANSIQRSGGSNGQFCHLN